MSETTTLRAPPARYAIVIGCGYLGCRTAAVLLDRGFSVAATTRTDRRRPALHALGVEAQLFDLRTSVLTERMFGERGSAPLDIYFMLTPSAITAAQGSGGGFDRLVQGLDSWSLRRAMLVSSTSAYGSNGGGFVTAETFAEPHDERGGRVVDIERRWLAAGDQFHVCRLAGLYGPERIIGRRQLNAGDAISGRSDRWLNLIHVEDAARLVVACNLSPDAKKIELGSDGQPVQRGDYYNFLAAELGTALPVRFDVDDSSGRTASSRRCDPSSTMERVGWRPRYDGYREGLKASLAEE